MSKKRKGAQRLSAAVAPPWTWVSCLGAVESALRVLGVGCDSVGIAGLSGYAFLVNVSRRLLPGSVTAFDWKLLEEGITAAGVAVEVIAIDSPEDGEDRQRLMAELFERVREEIDSGKPCVVWGAASVPEFAVAYGYEGDGYLVRSLRSAGAARGVDAGMALGPAEQPEPPVRFDALAAPDRLGLIAFGDRLTVDRKRMEHRALVRAAQLLDGQHACFEPGYAGGWRAFESWAEALAGGDYDTLGNSYLLRCYRELQFCAAGFCTRLEQIHHRASPSLAAAAGSFQQAANRLQALCDIFPLAESQRPPGSVMLSQAARSLEACAANNREAVAALRDAAALC